MKSQISVEFLLLTSILIFLVGATILVSGNFQTNVFEGKVYSSAREICRKISSEISIAVKIGDGYKREFFLEEKLFGNLDYSVEVDGYSIKIKWDEKYFSCNSLVERVNGEIKRGKNVLQNKNDEIYFE